VSEWNEWGMKCLTWDTGTINDARGIALFLVLGFEGGVVLV